MYNEQRTNFTKIMRQTVHFISGGKIFFGLLEWSQVVKECPSYPETRLRGHRVYFCVFCSSRWT